MPDIYKYIRMCALLTLLSLDQILCLIHTFSGDCIDRPTRICYYWLRLLGGHHIMFCQFNYLFMFWEIRQTVCIHSVCAGMIEQEYLEISFRNLFTRNWNALETYHEYVSVFENSTYSFICRDNTKWLCDCFVLFMNCVHFVDLMLLRLRIQNTTKWHIKIDISYIIQMISVF